MKHWTVAAAVFAAATLVFVAPLLGHFASAYPHDPGDPSLNAWILWWSTRALPFTQPWWNAPMFYPMRGALALSEVLVGLLPITVPIQALTGSPLAAYNTAFVLSFPLCGLAMYALAFEVTGDRIASLLAGLAYAFSPYRMSQLGHLQVLAYYGAPIALLGLHRYTREVRLRPDSTEVRLKSDATPVGWLCVFGAGWLVQSLSNGYSMFHFAVFIALWVLWFARSRAVAFPIVVSWIVASLPLLPILLKYQAVHSALFLTRDINEIRGLGIDVADLFKSTPELIVWHRLLPESGVEVAAFPGITVVLAGLVGLTMWWRARRARMPYSGDGGLTLDQTVMIAIVALALVVTMTRLALGPWRIGPLSVTEARKPFSIAVLALLILPFRTRFLRRAASERSTSTFYLLAMCAMLVLALGPMPKMFGIPILYRPPYEWLMALPGFSTLRVPARFLALATLSTSVLLAMVIARVSAHLSSRTIIVALVAGGLVIDGAARLPVAAAPSKGPTWTNADAVIELPAGGLADFGAIHRGMFHGLPILNGYSGYFPPHYLPLLYALDHGHFEVLQEFPSERGIAASIDRFPSNSVAMSAAIRDLTGSIHLGASDHLDTYLIHGNAVAPSPTGRPLHISTLSTNRTPGDARRMLDGRIDTAWHAAPPQMGDEEVLADLGAPENVGAVSIEMGPYAFGFPRSLAVEVSLDRQAWTRVWSGATDVLTVRGALSDPGRVPIRIVIAPATARYVRLRQTSQESGVAWWIAELSVHAPPGH